MTIKKLKAVVEALLFSGQEPLTLKVLTDLTETSRKEVMWVLDELRKEYAQDGRGVELVEIAEGFIFASRQEYSGHVQKLLSERKAAPLSYAALETLAIIAYQQPVTRGEIEKIRGVSADRTVQTLLERQLIKEVGRLESPGRPIMYGTTVQFMIHFGLKDLNHLPPLNHEELTGEKTDVPDDPVQ